MLSRLIPEKGIQSCISSRTLLRCFKRGVKCTVAWLRSQRPAANHEMNKVAVFNVLRNKWNVAIRYADRNYHVF